MASLIVQHFYDKDTSTLTYIVFDLATKDAVIIDPVLDYDPASGKVESHSLKKLLLFIAEHKLNPHFCLETHAHADHLSSSQFLKKEFPQLKVAIGKNITIVQESFAQLFDLKDFSCSGNQFDKLIQDGEEFSAGSLKIKAIPTPGHTPACLSFLIGHYLFTGDALFVDDSGTGRCDFPEGSAKKLYHSIHEELFHLPDRTIVYVGHDYQPNERELKFETTIGSAKNHNTQLRADTTLESYVEFRESRDQTLKAPRLLFQSIQVNINAGHLPKYLVMPLFNKTGY
jgi:glyoxylase-like metal-dependent hydrolase (beta-lactamase superfamily II)